MSNEDGLSQLAGPCRKDNPMGLSETILTLLLKSKSGFSAVDVGLGPGVVHVQPDAHRLQNYLDLFEIIGNRLKGTEEGRNLVLVIALPPTEVLSVSPPSDPGFLMNEDCLAIFYLIPGNNFMIDADEEYRKHVLSTDFCDVVFRSWRSMEFAREGWEFSNDIFILPSN